MDNLDDFKLTGSYYNGDSCTHEIHLECLRYPEFLKVPKEDFYCPACPPPSDKNETSVVRTVSTQRIQVT